MTLCLEQLSTFVVPERIGFLKFILEGYDGLAIITTTNRTTGGIVIRFFPSQRGELLSILDDLGVKHNEFEPDAL